MKESQIGFSVQRRRKIPVEANTISGQQIVVILFVNEKNSRKRKN
jgi:hypothetical protein